MPIGDPFASRNPGDPLLIPAAAFNVWNEMGRGYKRSRINIGSSPLLEPVPPGQMLIKNTSGVLVPRFGTLAIGGALISPSASGNQEAFVNQTPLSGSAPVAATDSAKFVVAVEPIADGAIGRAYVNGVFACQINVVDATHTCCDVPTWSSGGDDKFMKTVVRGPAKILYKESGTGDKYAIVAYTPCGITPYALFAVNVTQTGGSAGSNTTACSFTYTVADKGGTTLATVQTPESARPAKGKLIAATKGMAYYNASGTLVLSWINETLDVEVCT